ncbi:hypothetical protein H6P81_011877 [Aristolochia fimbriata]|uniref:CCT domain-containing protein n=1 Tax=Aristolochia fimbriata TaxID=158543 RepID=A0AAV7EBW5_ARIFI|nr:hypothetical protein H6P81_011877 [Aristolochia fimbriata]
MLQDAVHPPEQLQIEGMSSPVAAHLFDFCDPSLFPETLQNSDVSSCSGCGYEETASYANDLSFSSFPSDIPNFTDPTAAAAAASNPASLLHEAAENNNPGAGAAGSLSFYSSAFSALPYDDHFDLATMQIPISDVERGGEGLISQYNSSENVNVVTIGGGPCSLGTVFEEDALSSILPHTSYVRMDPASPSSSSFLDHHHHHHHHPHHPQHMAGYGLPTSLDAGMCPDLSSIFQGNFVAEDLEFQGENCGVYCSESVYAPGDLQVMGESQQQQIMKNGCGSPAGLTSDMSNLEEQSGFGKPPRITLEERKLKIRRYRKKRHERNFNKKIKYACRKTLADSRPRVRGRFAKNDDFGEAARLSRSGHEDELDEDQGRRVVVMVKGMKAEEEMVDSSDILAQISGLNSFKNNFSIPSWT